MIIFDIEGNIWFKYKDILKTLQYTSIDKAINKFDISSNFKQKYNNIEVLPSREVPFNFQNNTLFINESGLYEVLSKSTKPIAKIFMNKYFTDIMPQIRKSGIYVSSKKDLNKINELNSKLNNLKDKVNNLKDENNFLDNKHRFHPSSNGYAYINQTTCICKGKKKKCYKFGITENIKTRIPPYKTGNPTFKLLYYIPLNIDINQLETCIVSVMMPHEVKKNNETVSFISLNKLKTTINDCASMIANHICHCYYCKQQIKFNDIDVHNCEDIGKLTYISTKPSKNSKKGSKLSKNSKKR